MIQIICSKSNLLVGLIRTFSSSFELLVPILHDSSYAFFLLYAFGNEPSHIPVTDDMLYYLIVTFRRHVCNFKGIHCFEFPVKFNRLTHGEMSLIDYFTKCSKR